MTNAPETESAPSPRTRVRLAHELGTYDKQAIYAIVDEAPICHVSAIVDEAPYVQATTHWRIDDKVYVHGAVKNKLVHAIHQGAEACLSFTLFDGYVLPRSAFNHTILYRSVIAYSMGRFVEGLDEREHLLHAYMDRVHPGRWDTIRQPSETELKQTGIIELSLDEASGKVMPTDVAPYLLPGGPLEAPEDAEVSPWTGIQQVALRTETPLPADQL